MSTVRHVVEAMERVWQDQIEAANERERQWQDRVKELEVQAERQREVLTQNNEEHEKVVEGYEETLLQVLKEKCELQADLESWKRTRERLERWREWKLMKLSGGSDGFESAGSALSAMSLNRLSAGSALFARFDDLVAALKNFMVEQCAADAGGAFLRELTEENVLLDDQARNLVRNWIINAELSKRFDKEIKEMVNERAPRAAARAGVRNLRLESVRHAEGQSGDSSANSSFTARLYDADNKESGVALEGGGGGVRQGEAAPEQVSLGQEDAAHKPVGQGEVGSEQGLERHGPCRQVETAPEQVSHWHEDEECVSPGQGEAGHEQVLLGQEDGGGNKEEVRLEGAQEQPQDQRDIRGEEVDVNRMTSGAGFEESSKREGQDLSQGQEESSVDGEHGMPVSYVALKEEDTEERGEPSGSGSDDVLMTPLVAASDDRNSHAVEPECVLEDSGNESPVDI